MPPALQRLFRAAGRSTGSPPILTETWASNDGDPNSTQTQPGRLDPVFLVKVRWLDCSAIFDLRWAYVASDAM